MSWILLKIRLYPYFDVRFPFLRPSVTISTNKIEKIEFCHFRIFLVLYSISKTLYGRGTLNLRAGSKIQVPFFKLVKSMQHLT